MADTPTKRFVQTSFGQIATLESGAPTLPPVLFIHGIPTSGFLWRHVLDYLAGDFHCYAPDLMGLGDTAVDPRTTPFHMEAQAEMLVEFMAAQGHQRFDIVCHDQGGAAAQIIAARMPQVIRRLVLTDCVCFDNWPVPAIRLLQALSRLPGVFQLVSRSGLAGFIERSTPLSNFRRGVFNRERLTDATIAEYLRPILESREGGERFISFLQAGHPRYTQLAVSGLRRFTQPTLVIWAADDYYLSPSWGVKLLEEIPGAQRLELVPFCGHFWQEERPAEFACKIGEFLAESDATVASAEETAPDSGEAAVSDHGGRPQRSRTSRKKVTLKQVTDESEHQAQ